MLQTHDVITLQGLLNKKYEKEGYEEIWKSLLPHCVGKVVSLKRGKHTYYYMNCGGRVQAFRGPALTIVSIDDVSWLVPHHSLPPPALHARGEDTSQAYRITTGSGHVLNSNTPLKGISAKGRFMAMQKTQPLLGRPQS